MRLRVTFIGLLFAVVVGACSNKTDHSARESKAAEAAASGSAVTTSTSVDATPALAPITATPPDLSLVLNKPTASVESALGKGEASEFDDARNYVVGPVKFLITYREQFARDVIMASESAKPSDIKKWLALAEASFEKNGRPFVLSETDDTISILDAQLPKKRIDIKRALGKRAAGLRAVLGKPENEVSGFDVFKPWAPDDRIGVIAYYGADARATHVEVSMDDGPAPATNRQELSSYARQLEWLGLPVADEVTVGSEHYAISVSAGTIRLKLSE